ncbi:MULTISPECIES: FmdB family zinc ribbon protein [Prauserella salsuginis group]|uniref:Zinc ribbon domain-containing protein n=1 Tax=Prauserella salsuginis TaxID=387889 RepID=A0ABW6G3Y8_9PSEU|nr:MULTISPECIES: zinc ribbon domain-containing protein [Prauserella salsuginis group]MCR3718330.1 putative regulatory protein, FmdB family [Prauserella flava]MCR3732900.1 putative regulatory protein, FmdB family [Prauserella salsuginis]
MPLFDYRCACGARFEKLQPSWRSPDPDCPACGATTARLPSAVSLAGGARPPVGPDRAPTSWEGTGRGDREYVAQWRRNLEHRERLAEKYPELSTRRDAVAAHEGRFERAPLTYRELAQRASASGDASAAAADAARSRRVGGPGDGASTGGSSGEAASGGSGVTGGDHGRA